MMCFLLLYLTLLLLLQALRSFKLTVTVDPKYHPKIIGRKGAVITQIRTEHEVNIQFPDKDDESQVRGHKMCKGVLVVTEHRKHSIFFRALNSQHWLWIRWRGKSGRKVARLLMSLVAHTLPCYQAQDQITITGYEKNAEAARDAIMKIVGELEQMVSEDVTLDHRVHARIIGARGKAIRKIMDEFKVSTGAMPHRLGWA